MQTYDLIMLAILIAATCYGAWKGFAWQLASLAAISASYLVAFQFRNHVAAWIPLRSPLNTILAMLLLFMGTSALIWLVFRWVRQWIDRVHLKDFDRQIGALFGLAKGLLLCMLITLFSVTLLGDKQRQAVVRSRSGYYMAVLLDKSRGGMPRELSKWLGPYLDELDDATEQGG